MHQSQTQKSLKIKVFVLSFIFFLFFFVFFSFLQPHFLVLFSQIFFFKFSQQSLVRHVYRFFFSLKFVCFLFCFFHSQVNCSLCLLHFCFPFTSILITSNFISPSLVISVINQYTHFNPPQLSIARNQTNINVSPFFSTFDHRQTVNLTSFQQLTSTLLP